MVMMNVLMHGVYYTVSHTEVIHEQYVNYTLMYGNHITAAAL